MSYVITQPCIGEKDASCHAVCPVDAIHPGPDHPDFDRYEQLYINPAECIDCGACEPVCPHEAIVEDSAVPAGAERFIAINADFFTWPRA